MSNIKISELTEATEANENDLLMIIQNGENKKIKASKVGTGQAGVSVPTGGTTGQILSKNSNTDYDFKWINNTGSTESGEGYIKYPDGTMVCYGTVSITNPTHNDWYGFCRLSNGFTFSLAKAFKDNNYSLTISSTAFGYFSTIITSKTTNSFTLRACTHNQDAYTPKDGTFNYIAIGKWK